MTQLIPFLADLPAPSETAWWQFSLCVAAAVITLYYLTSLVMIFRRHPPIEREFATIKGLEIMRSDIVSSIKELRADLDEQERHAQVSRTRIYSKLDEMGREISGQQAEVQGLTRQHVHLESKVDTHIAKGPHE